MESKSFMVVILGLLISLSGCASKSLHKKLTESPATPHYLIEPEYVEKTHQSIYLETDTSFVPYMLPGQVKNDSWYMIPLIFYWKFHSSHMYRLGREGIMEQPHEFLRTGFLNEAQRKCKFNFTPYKDSADYVMVLRLDSTGSKSLLVADSHTLCIPIGPYVVYSSVSTRNLADAQAFCAITYDLYDNNNQRLLTKKYMAQEDVPDFMEMHLPLNYLNSAQTANVAMVEGVGKCFRQNFESIIKDLNALKSEEKEDILRDLIGQH